MMRTYFSAYINKHMLKAQRTTNTDGRVEKLGLMWKTIYREINHKNRYKVCQTRAMKLQIKRNRDKKDCDRDKKNELGQTEAEAIKII